MKEITELDRGVFEDALLSQVDKYIPFVKEWYKQYHEHIFYAVGAFPMEPLGDLQPPEGLMYRFNISEMHSAIKGLQAFPFVSVSDMVLPRANGCVRNMVKDILGTTWYDYIDMYLIVKQGLVHTNNARTFIAFVSPEFFDKLPRGFYMWISEQEVISLSHKVVPHNVYVKAHKWATSAYTDSTKTIRGIRKEAMSLRYDIEDTNGEGV
jgi:hypothetical protein